jgi:FkbM family methyltransferase
MSAAATLKTRLTAQPRLYDALRMPFAAGRYALRKPHDPDYGAFALFPERRGLFLDVGANAGQSASSFRIHAPNPILSVEPNPFHRRDLLFVGRMVRNFRFLIAGAGEREEELRLYIPVYRGVPITAEAALSEATVSESEYLRKQLGPGRDSDEFEIVSRSVRIIPLDRLGLSPDFVKLDVQGHELAALRGLGGTLERSRPILLVETPDEPVRDYLESLGYSSRLFDSARRELVADDRWARNVVFLPDGYQPKSRPTSS